MRQKRFIMELEIVKIYIALLVLVVVRVFVGGRRDTGNEGPRV